MESRRTIATDPVSGRTRRERDRQLRPPVPLVLSSWLNLRGPDLIAPALWRTFQDGHGSARSKPSAVLGEGLVRADHYLDEAQRLLPRQSPEARMMARIRRMVRLGIRLASE
jgi:hypothetical protein